MQEWDKVQSEMGQSSSQRFQGEFEGEITIGWTGKTYALLELAFRIFYPLKYQ